MPYVHIPELTELKELIMATRDDFNQYRTDVATKLDAIDDRLEALRVEVQAGNDARNELDALSTEIAEARAALANVNPEDPSGDDPQPEQPAEPTP